jgi:NodT family efflux transporter outer membrane factor (OMF) lipoprotein
MRSTCKRPARSPRAAWGVALAAALALAGCAAGPNFVPPAPPKVADYTAHALTNLVAIEGIAGGEAQQFQRGADAAGDWWTLFGSAGLDALVTRALDHNHDLKAAEAALRVAHEDVLAQRGAFFPAVSAGFDASRQRQPGSLAPVPDNNAYQYSLITPQLTISYAPDLFGANRRTRESLKAQAQVARFQMLAVRNTLTTNVVVTAVEEASLCEQERATRELVTLQRHSLDVLRLRLQKGYASKLDVAAQAAQLAQTEAGLPPLVKQLAATRHALATLVGEFPEQSPVPTFTLASLHLPADLPLSLPSALVAQRPDIGAARANLHAASAAIGIAAAARLPSIDLSANVGSTALAMSKVFDSGTGFWGIAASLTAPIFQAGQLKHQERAAKAAYVEAAQQYRGTVLGAFQNVADTLVAIEQDAKALRAAAAAERAAQTTLDLSRLQLRHGYIGGFELLAAEQSFQQAQIALVQAEANRFADTAALYQALGGGWWHDKNLAGQ